MLMDVFIVDGSVSIHISIVTDGGLWRMQIIAVHLHQSTCGWNLTNYTLSVAISLWADVPGAIVE